MQKTSISPIDVCVTNYKSRKSREKVDPSITISPMPHIGQCSGGSKGGSPGTPPSLRTKIFYISCRFLGKSGKFVSLRPPGLVPPPTGESWIRPCSGVFRIYGGGGGGVAPTDYLTKILSNFVLVLDRALYVSIIIFLEEFVKTEKTIL